MSQPGFRQFGCAVFVFWMLHFCISKNPTPRMRQHVVYPHVLLTQVQRVCTHIHVQSHSPLWQGACILFHLVLLHKTFQATQCTLYYVHHNVAVKKGQHRTSENFRSSISFPQAGSFQSRLISYSGINSFSITYAARPCCLVHLLDPWSYFFCTELSCIQHCKSGSALPPHL